MISGRESAVEEEISQQLWSWLTKMKKEEREKRKNTKTLTQGKKSSVGTSEWMNRASTEEFEYGLISMPTRTICGVCQICGGTTNERICQCRGNHPSQTICRNKNVLCRKCQRLSQSFISKKAKRSKTRNIIPQATPPLGCRRRAIQCLLFLLRKEGQWSFR